MAAVDDGRAGLIVYNGTGKTASAKVSFEGIPFEKGDVFVYLVDDEHHTYSTANPPCLVEWAEDVSVNDLAANLELKPDAAYYIEIDNADGTPPRTRRIILCANISCGKIIGILPAGTTRLTATFTKTASVPSSL